MKLSDLKTGDKVVNHYGWNSKRVLTVEKVTPTGMINAGGQLYKKDGSARNRSSWDTDFIIPATEQLIKEIEDRGIIRQAFDKMHQCTGMTVSQARQIIDILAGKV